VKSSLEVLVWNKIGLGSALISKHRQRTLPLKDAQTLAICFEMRALSRPTLCFELRALPRPTIRDIVESGVSLRFEMRAVPRPTRVAVNTSGVFLFHRWLPFMPTRVKCFINSHVPGCLGNQGEKGYGEQWSGLCDGWEVTFCIAMSCEHARAKCTLSHVMGRGPRGSKDLRGASDKHPGPKMAPKSAKRSFKRRRDGHLGGQHEAKMDPRWTKRARRWPYAEPGWAKRQPRWPLGASKASHLGYFWKPWNDFLLRSPKYKIEHPYSVFNDFWGSGGSGWRLLGAILGDLGLSSGYLGRSCLPVSTLVTNANDHLFRGVISLAITKFSGMSRVGQLVGQLSFEKVCVT